MANGTVNSMRTAHIKTTDSQWLLKESARRVTDAILSKGSSNAMDASFALKQWHALRYLAVVAACVVAKSGVRVFAKTCCLRFLLELTLTFLTPSSA